MSVVSDSVRPHRWQPTRLPNPWDSPGKNTGVGCHFFLQCMKVKSESEVARSCPTLSNPMDCSLPGSSTHGIFQARVLEWVAISFSNISHYGVTIRARSISVLSTTVDLVPSSLLAEIMDSRVIEWLNVRLNASMTGRVTLGSLLSLTWTSMYVSTWNKGLLWKWKETVFVSMLDTKRLLLSLKLLLLLTMCALTKSLNSEFLFPYVKKEALIQFLRKLV